MISNSLSHYRLGGVCVWQSWSSVWWPWLDLEGDRASHRDQPAHCHPWVPVGIIIIIITTKIIITIITIIVEMLRHGRAKASST